jgi:hypothetical protein
MSAATERRDGLGGRMAASHGHRVACSVRASAGRSGVCISYRPRPTRPVVALLAASAPLSLAKAESHQADSMRDIDRFAHLIYLNHRVP